MVTKSHAKFPLLLILPVLVSLEAFVFKAQSLQSELNPIKVEVVSRDGKFELLRGGKSYFINGAGGGKYLDQLVASGGNSIRTWGSKNGHEILDEAHKRGLTVTMGLNVARERHGFDYNDSEAVAKQLQELKDEVMKYKDHPALLMWGIGNELNLQYTNTKVWDAVNDIARMIHENDPNHPASTMLAGLKKKEVDLIKSMAPEIDVLAINAYGELVEIPKAIREYGWNGPYMITEWGPTGHWECPLTEWGAPIEETSSEKAEVYKLRYTATIGQDKEKCLGSYVFLWGQKQERTPTWYGMFTESGQETEVIDVMQELWSGKGPENKTPKVEYMKLDGKKATQSIYLVPNKTYKALASIYDSDKDNVKFRWELLPESTDLSVGGDHESRPRSISDAIAGKDNEIVITAPQKEGAYRLIMYATDGNNNVATANIPFYVKGSK
ncbi:MAG TPA: glycoside hydrolase family 2 TIM barrel-domain containing protein [Cytophagales bacterium]|nr:glycoside hydrolase family 2 TIM barrel-domain containing protein [Cytophagales bacterium]